MPVAYFHRIARQLPVSGSDSEREPLATTWASAVPYERVESGERLPIGKGEKGWYNKRKKKGVA